MSAWYQLSTSKPTIVFSFDYLSLIIQEHVTKPTTHHITSATRTKRAEEYQCGSQICGLDVLHSQIHSFPRHS